MLSDLRGTWQLWAPLRALAPQKDMGTTNKALRLLTPSKKEPGLRDSESSIANTKNELWL